jgi:hypothetical protein
VFVILNLLLHFQRSEHIFRTVAKQGFKSNLDLLLPGD